MLKVIQYHLATTVINPCTCCPSFSAVFPQQQPSRRAVSLEEAPTAAEEEMKEQLKGYDMDPHPSAVCICLVKRDHVTTMYRDMHS